MPRLRDASPAAAPDAPLVTILVPAKDESSTIERGLRTKLSVDYPNFEIIVIDDRSSDGTGDIARRVAEGDDRVRVLRIDTLPAGWLGKLNALDHGIREARGEWILMSDADVAFSPSTLSRAINFAKDADFLSLMPRFESVSLAVDALMHDFLRTVVPFAQARAVEDPSSRVAVGGGVFNLVRRAAYEKTPGFAWIKLEIGDDIAFGQMMKRCGARCRIADASDDVHLALYPSVRAHVRGMTKTAWPVLGNFSRVRLTAACLLLLFLNLAPLALLGMGPQGVRIAASAALVFSVAGAATSNMRFGRAFLPSLFAPLAGAFAAITMLLAGLGQSYRGGVLWRGTFYDNATLQQGRRLTLPWQKTHPPPRL